MPNIWHEVKAPPVIGCVHCFEGSPESHYMCTEAVPCQDCMDDAAFWAEEARNYLVNDYGPQGY